MSSRFLVRRRFRVVARPSDRARRAKMAAAVLAMGFLGVVAVAAARHAADAFARARRALPLASSAESALVGGVSEPFRALAQSVVDAAAGSAGEKASALRERFACVSDVEVRRSWGESRATITPILRRAVALARRHGKAAGYLGEDGSVFDAPSGVFALSGPVVDVAGAPDSELKILARQWALLAAPGAFPAPLGLLAYRSAEDGWEARLADGTTVLWGRLEWTREKLSRLSAALTDAHAKEAGSFAADLRYFEDGKVLLKPVGQAMAAGVRGNVR